MFFYEGFTKLTFRYEVSGPHGAGVVGALALQQEAGSLVQLQLHFPLIVQKHPGRCQ